MKKTNQQPRSNEQGEPVYCSDCGNSKSPNKNEKGCVCEPSTTSKKKTKN